MYSVTPLTITSYVTKRDLVTTPMLKWNSVRNVLKKKMARDSESKVTATQKEAISESC